MLLIQIDWLLIPAGYPFFILEHLTPLGLELKEEPWLSLTLCGEGRDTLRQGPPSHLSQGENKAGS